MIARTILLALLLSTTAFAADQRKRVFVQKPNLQGAAPGLSALVESLLDRSIAANAGYRVTSFDDLKAALTLEQAKQLIGCTDSGCVASLNRSMSADYVVLSTVGQFGNGIVLTLALIEGNKPEPIARVSETLQHDELPTAVPRMVSRVLPGGAQAKAAFKLPKGKKLSFAVFDLRAAGVTQEVAQ
ncbi:MAG: hypothetical protein ACHQ50_17115, partial [Fimbriimonadales bacterium]